MVSISRVNGLVKDGRVKPLVGSAYQVGNLMKGPYAVSDALARLTSNILNGVLTQAQQGCDERTPGNEDCALKMHKQGDDSGHPARVTFVCPNEGRHCGNVALGAATNLATAAERLSHVVLAVIEALARPIPEVNVHQRPEIP